MKELQQAKDWLAQNNYDDNQYVFLNGNSPHGVNKEGQPLESVLTNYLLENNEIQELGQFLNWFIRHYSTETTTDRGLMYYANAEGKEVSIAEILEHYKNKWK